MEFWTDASLVPADFGPSAVTVGKFDGVHAGHRAVIDRLVAVADERGLVPTVVTFDRNPLSVVRPEACPDPLVSNEQKRELLEEAGVGATLMVTFDEEFRSMAPEDFVSGILVGALHATAVLVGADFRFGARGAGDVALLRAMAAESGFEVIEIDDVASSGDRRVSSTWIRELLSAGDVRTAAELLGELPAIRAEVVHGAQRGRTLGYPTANLSPTVEGFIPADGVYASWLVVDGVPYGAAVSIGNNPTFEGVPEKQVEAHAFDQAFDLYGRTVEVRFVEFIRGMRKFGGADELAAQMRRDELRIRDILGLPPRAGE
ncbi:bifunctional riboflavin kinase/FAD synthetase [Antiquaquibacter soli]|uniref:Riboflavin biosynthesis protein n=1 Tax=Antiquaquibacter soli TaxID=3064523 RepID=A0ABT9BQA8_9MICO|nr:bifunctional riboflavin kinase/FAD synthetase [Protaetiibacter sp. WY-16]MDO7881605.1 bifunctional riboflavin kinase/FAD synthetase [Protaetiibacter sp. WY-16]